MNTRSIATLHKRHQHPGHYTIIEGDPGAGKTTAIHAAAQHPDIAVLSEINHLTEYSNVPGRDLRAVQEWYILKERTRQAEVHRLLAAGRHVFQDRSFLSTLAFAYALPRRSRRDELPSLLHRIANGPAIIVPDRLIIMQVSQHISVERRKAFSQMNEYAEWFDPHFLARFRQFFHIIASTKLAAETIVIDTTDMTLTDVEGCVGMMRPPLT